MYDIKIKIYTRIRYIYIYHIKTESTLLYFINFSIKERKQYN